MWYIGTANNDDSTFAITDKVYDRAMPINIDTKGVPFDAPLTDPVYISYKHFEYILNAAKVQFVVSEENFFTATTISHTQSASTATRSTMAIIPLIIPIKLWQICP